jgi:prepilin-type N-terminal cleavage/methylation domain-containing protein
MSLHPDKSRHSKGFTLVEALVALVILTVGLIPAFQQATTAVNLSASIRNSLIAANLAQEGVEMVRAFRDANWFAVKPFDTGLTGCTAGCLVQYNGAAVTALNGNPFLRLDPLTGLYQYTQGDESIFHRKLVITSVSANELKVTSEVTWNERSGAKQHIVEYHLFNWLK